MPQGSTSPIGEDIQICCFSLKKAGTIQQFSTSQVEGKIVRGEMREREREMAQKGESPAFKSSCTLELQCFPGLQRHLPLSYPCRPHFGPSKPRNELQVCNHEPHVGSFKQQVLKWIQSSIWHIHALPSIRRYSAATSSP